MSSSGDRKDSVSVGAWEPDKILRSLSQEEIRWSRGFLRSRPERWFPGFAAQWLPFAHSLGTEARIVEVKPALGLPESAEVRFQTYISGQPCLVAFEEAGAAALVEEVTPEADKVVGNLLLEYLARRILGTVLKSWTGQKAEADSFTRLSSQESSQQIVGSIKVVAVLNTSSIAVWFGLTAQVIDQLDGMWRRQVQSTSPRPNSGPAVSCVLELVQLGVPPQMLSDYLKPQTVVDLEVKVSDFITLRLLDKPWVSARILNLNGNFLCEVQPGPVTVFNVAEGMTRLSIEFGRIELEPSEVAELSQGYAVLETKLPLSNKVSLVINQEEVARATLQVYEGRFAIAIS